MRAIFAIPGLAEESTPSPAQKVKRGSLGELRGVSDGSRPIPQKSQKPVSRERLKKRCSFWGVGLDPSETHPETLFDFLSRGGF